MTLQPNQQISEELCSNPPETAVDFSIDSINANTFIDTSEVLIFNLV